MKLFALAVLLLSIQKGSCQATIVNTEIHSQVEQMPQFPGGNKALARLLTDSLDDALPSVKWQEEIDDEIGKSIELTFIIDEQGYVSDVQIIKSMDKVNDDKLVSVVKKLKFIPGMQDGKPVKVRYVLPYRYTLPSR